MSSEEERKELARRLLEQSPENWPAELQGLRGAARKMPPELRDRLIAMHRVPAVARGTASDFWRKRLLSAAAALLLAAGVGFGTYRYLQQDESYQAELVALSGAMKSAGNEARTGLLVAESDRLQASQEARAALALSLPAARIEWRIFGAAELQLARLRGDQAVVALSSGRLYSRMDRTGIEERPVALVIHMAHSAAEVRGTRFISEASQQQESLTGLEGEVRFRRRWDALEELPPSVLALSPLLERALEILQQANSVVGPATASTVPVADFDRRLNAVARLRSLLEAPAFSTLRQHSEASDSELQRCRQEIASRFPSAADLQAELTAFRLAFGDPPQVQSIGEERSDFLQQEAESMSEAERDARYASLRADLAGKGEVEFRAAAVERLGRAPQRIRLKSGKVIFGVIFGVEGRYRVYTADDTLLIAPEDIEEISFE
ncbi:MAG: hypothetical protein K1X75_04015 [Leptospirales bacterium]|nr:hypothetical protein [Leptospirales bacterium]